MYHRIVYFAFKGSKIYKRSFELNKTSELYPGWDSNPAIQVCNQPNPNTIECKVKDSTNHKDYTYAYMFYARGMILKRTNPSKNLSTKSTYVRIREPIIKTTTKKTTKTKTTTTTKTTMPSTTINFQEVFMKKWRTRPI